MPDGQGYALYAKGTIAYEARIVKASDERIKRDIKDMDSGLEYIMKLRPRKYYHIESDKYNFTSNLSYGLVAQEVKQVIPEIVVDKLLIERPNTNPESGAEELMGIDYVEIIPFLIKSIQEQQAIIEQQQKQIDILIKNR